MFSAASLRAPCSALAALALLAAGPGAGQTAVEAAAANVQLAITLCLRNYRTPGEIGPALAAAGFTYSPERYSDGSVLAWYETPSNSATVLLDVSPDLQSARCSISTDHFDVAQAIPFVGQVLEGITPGTFEFGEMEGVPPVTPDNPGTGGRSCTGYVGFLPRRAVVVRIGNAGPDPVCIRDGTSQIILGM